LDISISMMMGSRNVSGVAGTVGKLKDIGNATFLKDFQRTSILTSDYSAGDGTGTFTRTSDGSTNPATYIDQNGLIQVNNTQHSPRFTSGYYDSTGFHAQKGLMIERASTNQCFNSYFSDVATYWAGAGTGVVSSSSDFTNVYGGGSVLKFVGSAADDRFTNSATGNVTIANTKVYTLSSIVRGTGTLKYRFFDGTTSTYGTNTFTLDPNKWIRISDVITSTADSSGAKVGWAQVGATNVTAYFSTIQFEQMPYATSFIPTTTAALTRNVESLGYATSGNRTSATESIFLKFAPCSDFANDGKARTLSYSDTKERLIRKSTTSTKIDAWGNVTDSAAVTISSSTTPLANTSYVVAFTCSATGNPNSTIYLNGALETTDNTVFTAPAYGTNFYVASNGGVSPLDGIIQAVAIYSDVKLQTAVTAVTNILR
jgi:hypothetical protein